MFDVQRQTDMLVLHGPAAVSANSDGAIITIPITGIRGIAKAILVGNEDATITGTMTAHIHQVVDDDEATAAGNLVASFTTITGGNNGGITQFSQEIAINLDSLLTTKPYLQVRFVETGAWTGQMCVALISGNQYKVTTN